MDRNARRCVAPLVKVSSAALPVCQAIRPPRRGGRPTGADRRAASSEVPQRGGESPTARVGGFLHIALPRPEPQPRGGDVPATESPTSSAPPEPASSPSAVATLAPILAPASIAVIGASRTPGTIGHQILSNLITEGFTGPVYPVNTRARAVCSVPCVPAVSAIPEPPDLAVICVPKEAVVDVADECGAMGVRGLVVISAGFREVGGTAGRASRRCCTRHGVMACGSWVPTAWACSTRTPAFR